MPGLWLSLRFLAVPHTAADGRQPPARGHELAARSVPEASRWAAVSGRARSSPTAISIVCSSLEHRERQRLDRESEIWAAHRGRLLCICLGQGSACHLIDGCTEIKDFDLWTFFAHREDLPRRSIESAFRRGRQREFGRSRFGVRTDAYFQERFPTFLGRNVDMFAVAIQARPKEDPAAAVQAWLSDPPTCRADWLAKKAFVMLEPRRLEIDGRDRPLRGLRGLICRLQLRAVESGQAASSTGAVPLAPMACPTSATASAGASLMPSPPIATGPDSAERRDQCPSTVALHNRSNARAASGTSDVRSPAACGAARESPPPGGGRACQTCSLPQGHRCAAACGRP